MTKGPVIPVVIIENLDDAVPLADALLEGGVTTIEITLRSDAAMDAIDDLCRGQSATRRQLKPKKGIYRIVVFVFTDVIT